MGILPHGDTRAEHYSPYSSYRVYSKIYILNMFRVAAALAAERVSKGGLGPPLGKDEALLAALSPSPLWGEGCKGESGELRTPQGSTDGHPGLPG